MADPSPNWVADILLPKEFQANDDPVRPQRQRISIRNGFGVTVFVEDDEDNERTIITVSSSEVGLYTLKTDHVSTSGSSGYETVATLTYAIPVNTTVDVQFHALGWVGVEYAKYVRVASFSRLGSANAVMDWDQPPAGAPKESDPAWDARINLSTNDLQFQTKANGETPGPKWRLVTMITPVLFP